MSKFTSSGIVLLKKAREKSVKLKAELISRVKVIVVIMAAGSVFCCWQSCAQAMLLPATAQNFITVQVFLITVQPDALTCLFNSAVDFVTTGSAYGVILSKETNSKQLQRRMISVHFFI